MAKAKKKSRKARRYIVEAAVHTGEQVEVMARDDQEARKKAEKEIKEIHPDAYVEIEYCEPEENW